MECGADTGWWWTASTPWPASTSPPSGKSSWTWWRGTSQYSTAPWTSSSTAWPGSSSAEFSSIPSDRIQRARCVVTWCNLVRSDCFLMTYTLLASILGGFFDSWSRRKRETMQERISAAESNKLPANCMKLIYRLAARCTQWKMLFLLLNLI